MENYVDVNDFVAEFTRREDFQAALNGDTGDIPVGEVEIDNDTDGE